MIQKFMEMCKFIKKSSLSLCKSFKGNSDNVFLNKAVQETEKLPLPELFLNENIIWCIKEDPDIYYNRTYKKFMRQSNIDLYVELGFVNLFYL